MKIGRFIRILIILVLVSFSIYFLTKNWYDFKKYNIKINYEYLILSFLVAILSQVLLALAWQVIMESLNQKISFVNSMRIYFISQIIRYIPGKIWLIGGRIYLCGKEGISSVHASLGIVLELLLISLSNIILIILTSGLVNIKYFILITAIGLTVVYPKNINILVNIVLRILKRKPLKLTISYINILKVIILYIIFWLLLGVAFFLITQSIYKIDIILLPRIIGIHSLAWLLGFLSFLTPAAIGVREGLLSLFLKPYLPISLAIGISILARIIVTISELTILAASLISRKIENRRAHILYD